MAQARLGRPEAESNQLPGVCMRCGRPATVRIEKNFAWHPTWVWLLLPFGLIPAVVLGYFLTKRARVLAPLCSKHKWHWGWYSFGIFWSLIAILIGAAAVYFLNPRMQGEEIVTWLAVVLVVWLVASVLIYQRSIRATEITDHAITLTGVSEQFAEAVR